MVADQNAVMRRGFTLVELSIVLVIIGLLIGGILVAQSLVETSKINKVVGQIQQFDIGVRVFKDKFNGLPGDIKFDDSAPFGDGDGIIEGCVNPPTAPRTYDHCGENTNFWPMMQVAGFKIEGIGSDLPISTTNACLLYTSPSPRDQRGSRMPSSA